MNSTLKIRGYSLFVVVLLIGGLSIEAKAADIYPDDEHSQTLIHLVGDIRSGDAERLAIVMSEMTFASLLLVDSRGGDINESLKIVSLVKGTRLNIHVSKGKVCASSCFFVYLAGNPRVSSGWMVNDDGTLKSQERRDRSFGVVGIHRPYFKDPSGNPESNNKQIVLMRSVKKYLEEEGLSQYLIDQMMSHSSNDIYWLNDRDVLSIGEYSPNIEELLIAKCGYKNGSKRTDWSDEKENTLSYCIVDVLNKNDNSSRLSYLNKLRTGWRPWKK